MINEKRPVKLAPIQKNCLWGREDWMLSWQHEGFEGIPLLIKIITAREALSIQVHPGNEIAWEMEGGNGKTEMWFVLDCEPGACLYYGLKHRISQNEFCKRIQNGTILEICRRVPVRKGDVFYIPAGLIHAIGKGITVAEVQQSSDITYRVYDYDREDADHQKRPLHIEKAARAAGFLPPLAGHHPMGERMQKNGYSRTLLVQCPYFVVQYYEIEKCMEGNVKDSFQSLLVLDGEGCLESVTGNLTLSKGESIFLPKGMGTYRLAGGLQILISEVSTDEFKVWNRRPACHNGSGPGSLKSGNYTGGDFRRGGLCEKPE